MLPESEVTPKYFLTQQQIDNIVDRSRKVGTKRTKNKMESVLQSNAQGGRVYSTEGTSTTLTHGASYYGKHSGLYAIEQDVRPKLVISEKAKCYRVYSDDGVATTLTGNGGGVGAKTGLYATEVRPMLTPMRPKKRQNGRRLKEDGEDMFTLTAQDRHGIAIEKIVDSTQHTSVYGKDGVSPTLAACDYKDPNKVAVEKVVDNRSVPHQVFSEDGKSPCIAASVAKDPLKIAVEKAKLSDILEDEVDEKYWVSQRHLDDMKEGTLNMSSGDPGSGPRAVSEVKYSKSKKGGPRVKAGDDPMFTLRTETPHGVAFEVDTKDIGEQVEYKVYPNPLVTGESIQNRVYSDEGTSPTLTGTDYKRPRNVGIEREEPRPELLVNGRQQQDKICSDKGISPTIIATDYKKPKNVGIECQVTGKFKTEKIYSSEGESPCLLSSDWKNPAKVSVEPENNYGVLEVDGKSYNVRRLTPRECFRLQGFPDILFDKVRPYMSDSQLYKQAGNAVTVNVAYYIGKYILERANGVL